MSPVALDGTKLLILMTAGGVFALAGLWLMFRPPVQGQAAHVELFGMKFQSSSAGLLVFLIGAVFLAVPVFVPEREQRPGGAAPQGPGTPASLRAQARQGAGDGCAGNTVVLADGRTPGRSSPTTRSGRQIG